jgi:hypothetical protein
MRRFVAVVLAGGMLTGLAVAAENLEQRTAESRKVVQEFRGQFLEELQKAMKAGGPPAAIEVCHRIAPSIAANMAQKTGWEVGRTALKVRNPGNAADEWEKKVLESFQARKAKGESLEKMEFYEVVKQDGEKVFRYMKAIPMGAPCMSCHGAKIDSSVDARLKELYPQDQARGFKPGELRGAYTITQPM